MTLNSKFKMRNSVLKGFIGNLKKNNNKLEENL